jgi:adenylyltransferase/sulfurtransferase
MTIAHRLAAAGLLTPIYRAVEPAWPEEGCGFVFESPAGELQVLPTINRAPELHRRDPERYPRGGTDWFEPDMKPWFRAAREGAAPRVIFHSHPEVGAYFSQGDHDSAVMAEEDGRTVERNPGVLHMVVSVRQGRADGAKLFRFNSESATFDAVAEFDADGQIVD